MAFVHPTLGKQHGQLPSVSHRTKVTAWCLSVLNFQLFDSGFTRFVVVMLSIANILSVNTWVCACLRQPKWHSLTPQSLPLFMLVFPGSLRADRNFPLLTEIVHCQAKVKHGL